MNAKQLKDMLASIDEAEDNEELEEDGAAYRRPRTPREPSQVYSVRIPVERLAALRELADEEGITAASLVRRLVLEGLERLDGRHSLVEQLQDRVTELEEREARREKQITETVEGVRESLSALIQLPSSSF